MRLAVRIFGQNFVVARQREINGDVLSRQTLRLGK